MGSGTGRGARRGTRSGATKRSRHQRDQAERLFNRDAKEQTLNDAMNPSIRLRTLEAEN